MSILEDNIRKLLKEQDKTQMELADHLQVHRSTISRWLRQESAIPAYSLIGMAEFFDVSSDKLLGLI